MFQEKVVVGISTREVDGTTKAGDEAEAEEGAGRVGAEVEEVAFNTGAEETKVEDRKTTMCPTIGSKKWGSRQRRR